MHFIFPRIVLHLKTLLFFSLTQIAPKPPTNVKLYKAGDKLRVEWILADVYGAIRLFYQLEQSREWQIWWELEPHRTEETLRDFHVSEIRAIKLQGLGKDKCPGNESVVYLISAYLEDTNKDQSWKFEAVEVDTRSVVLRLIGPDSSFGISAFQVSSFSFNKFFLFKISLFG